MIWAIFKVYRKYFSRRHVLSLRFFIFAVLIGMSNNKDKKYGYKIEIVYSTTSWEDACELESFLIQLYGRKDLNKGTLVNLTDGGDGTLNHKVTKEQRIKLREARLGKKDSESTKLKKSKYSKNRTKSHTQNILNRIKNLYYNFH